MGGLVYFCAAANAVNLPGRSVEALLVNVVEHGATECRIEHTQALLRTARPKFVLLDSGGYSLLKAEEKGKKITTDPSKPIKNASTFNLAASHGIQSAVRLKPDEMVAWDWPLGKINGLEEREREFARKVGFNVQNAITTAELRGRYSRF